MRLQEVTWRSTSRTIRSTPRDRAQVHERFSNAAAHSDCGPGQLSKLEAIISILADEASLIYSDAFVAEDEPLSAARAEAARLTVKPVGPGGGAALRLLASIIDARAVLEIGTGTGVSGLWLLRGMNTDGVLTTIDLDSGRQEFASQNFLRAGVPQNRVATIQGPALGVLPDLAEGHYDLIFCDGNKEEYGHYLDAAVRLLRPGGVVAFDNALWHGRVANRDIQDEDTVAIRDLGLRLANDSRFVAALLPVGDGLLVARKS